RIEGRRKQTLGEISIALSLGRNIGDTRDSFPKVGVLIIRKKKYAVPDDGPFDRASQLFAVVIRGRLVRGSEDVSGIERFRSEESVGRAVPGVRSGACDDINLSSGIASEGCVVAIGEHSKLANAVNRKPHPRRVEFWI